MDKQTIMIDKTITVTTNLKLLSKSAGLKIKDLEIYLNNLIEDEKILSYQIVDDNVNIIIDRDVELALFADTKQTI